LTCRSLHVSIFLPRIDGGALRTGMSGCASVGLRSSSGRGMRGHEPEGCGTTTCAFRSAQVARVRSRAPTIGRVDPRARGHRQATGSRSGPGTEKRSKPKSSVRGSAAARRRPVPSSPSRHPAGDADPPPIRATPLDRHPFHSAPLRRGPPPVEPSIGARAGWRSVASSRRGPVQSASKRQLCHHGGHRRCPQRPAVPPSPRERGEGARRADEGLRRSVRVHRKAPHPTPPAAGPPSPRRRGEGRASGVVVPAWVRTAAEVRPSSAGAPVPGPAS
jgi:hypothetical protein